MHKLQYYNVSIIRRIIGAVKIILGIIGKKKRKFQSTLDEFKPAWERV